MGREWRDGHRSGHDAKQHHAGHDNDCNPRAQTSPALVLGVDPKKRHADKAGDVDLH
jgi:hypothetical protein